LFLHSSLRSAYCPVPVSFTFCGLPVALSKILIVPEACPAAVGWKITSKTHFFPGNSSTFEQAVGSTAAKGLLILTLLSKIPWLCPPPCGFSITTFLDLLLAFTAVCGNCTLCGIVSVRDVRTASLFFHVGVSIGALVSNTTVAILLTFAPF